MTALPANNFSDYTLRVLAYITENPGCAATDIAEALGGKRDTSVRSAIASLHVRHLIDVRRPRLASGHRSGTQLHYLAGVAPVRDEDVPIAPRVPAPDTCDRCGSRWFGRDQDGDLICATCGRLVLIERAS